MNDKQRDKFEQMVTEGAELMHEFKEQVAGQPDIPEPTEQDKPKIDFSTIFKSEPNTDTKETARILKCALDTQDYLGWLKGKTLEAKLESKFFEVGFYQGLYEKFVLENTP